MYSNFFLFFSFLNTTKVNVGDGTSFFFFELSDSIYLINFCSIFVTDFSTTTETVTTETTVSITTASTTTKKMTRTTTAPTTEKKSILTESSLSNFILDAHNTINKHLHHHDHRWGPHFEGESRNVTVQIGANVTLDCKISLLQGKTVGSIDQILPEFYRYKISHLKFRFVTFSNEFWIFT